MFVKIVDRVAGEVRELSPTGVPRGGLVDGLAALGRLRGALDAAEARFAGAISELGDRGADAATVLRSATRCSSREARKRGRRAESLAVMPRVADGLTGGRIPVEAVDALVSAAATVGADVVDSDTELLSLVGSRPADMAAREVRDWVRRHESSADLERRLVAQRAARNGVWFGGEGGMIVLHAELDPVAGASLRAILDAHTEALWRRDGGRDGTPDEIRTPAQRRADAITKALGISTPHSSGEPSADPGSMISSGSGHVSATVVVVADLGVITGADRDGRCEIIGTGPVPASILADLPANTDWCGALFDGPGRPLWLGRKRRLANPDQKLVLTVRDRGCVNCGAPAGRCHAHHVSQWVTGATTDIDQLVLLCPSCHTKIHEGHIKVHRQADSTWVATPAGLPPPAPG